MICEVLLYFKFGCGYGLFGCGANWVQTGKIGWISGEKRAENISKK